MSKATWKQQRAAAFLSILAVASLGGSSEACLFPGMPCIDDTFEAVYDVAFVESPIVNAFVSGGRAFAPIASSFESFFEKVAEGDADALVNFAVDAAINEVTSTINDAVNCFAGITGDPTCNTLGTLQACANTALTAAPAAKKTSQFAKLSASKQAKFNMGIKALKNAKSAVEKLCGDECDSGRCSGAARVVPKVPSGCECRQMEARRDGEEALTPSTCAYNIAHMVNGEWKRHTDFSYAGCYIGTFTEEEDDDDDDSTASSSSSSSKYRIVESGTCASAGMIPITQSGACETAAAALRLSDKTASATSQTPRPEGCYWWKGSSLQLSTNSANRGNGAASTRHPICASRSNRKRKSASTQAYVTNCMRARGVSALRPQSSSNDKVYTSNIYPNGVFMRCVDDTGDHVKNHGAGQSGSSGGSSGSGAGVLHSTCTHWSSLMGACALSMLANF